MSIVEARRIAEENLFALPTVVGIGSARGRLKVYVEHNPVDIPSTYMGVPVDVIITGKIRALNMLQPTYGTLTGVGAPLVTPTRKVGALRTGRYRPVPGGVSIGHPQVTAGTNGVNLTFLGKPYGLSNNHVLAATSTNNHPRADLGDPTLQPGSYDGGNPDDEVGTLYDFVELKEETYNYVDAALWQPHNEEDLDDEILDIGVPVGVSEAKVGDIVQKSGRTTYYNTGEVIDVDATISVSYSSEVMTFTNQIVTTNMASGGDSGSALLDLNNNLVGLLFAGSSSITIHNHIGRVLEAFDFKPRTPRDAVRLIFGSSMPLLLGAVMTSRMSSNPPVNY
jgi:hypothetical protein